MSVRSLPACCAVTAEKCSRPLLPHRGVHRQQACGPFQAVRHTPRLHVCRPARLACSASADGWWRAGEQHWTFVDSAEQLQQVVDGAPNLVLVGQLHSCALPCAATGSHAWYCLLLIP